MRFSQRSRQVRGAARVAARLAAGWLAGLTLVGGCGSDSRDDENEFKDRVPTVEVVEVQPELLRDVVKFGGELAAEKSVVLYSEVEGIIDSIEFDEGERVREGDILFRLRDDEPKARLREAQATLALAQAENKRAGLLLDRKAASRATRDRTIAELSVAEARVELAHVALRRTRIRAPFDGVLGMRLVAPGALVSDKVALVQVDAVERLQALFALPEIALPIARAGIRVEIMVAPYPGERFPGEVFFISPSLDTTARRLVAKAWVPNRDGRLAPGLYANIDVEVARRENALVVPESAVVADRLGTFVWRLGEGDVAERVPVELGLRKDGRAEVTLGLHPGDRIVTAGTHKVGEGKRVAIAPAPGSGQASIPTGAEPAGEGT